LWVNNGNGGRSAGTSAAPDILSSVKSPASEMLRVRAAQDHHAGDWLFSKSLERLASDPAFAGLSEQQQIASLSLV
jgi:hypothetical protein